MNGHGDGATLNRRAFLAGASGLVAVGSLGAAVPRAGASAALDLGDPATNVSIFARISSNTEPGSQGHVLYQGKAFGINEDGRTVPFYGIEGLGSLGAIAREEGAYGFLFNEFAIYTDLETGEPLQTWKNPLSGETVEVWHQRNGPVNYEIHPSKTDIAFFTLVQRGGGFRLPWVIDGDEASFRLDSISNRPNPLDPEKWPRESTGATLPISEHSQYFLKLSEINDPALTSLPFRAALQSLKPWHPWMLMGKQPGKVFTVMTARKVSGLDAMTPAVANYASKHLAGFTQAPREWTGEYVTAYSLYQKERQPAGRPSEE